MKKNKLIFYAIPGVVVFLLVVAGFYYTGNQQLKQKIEINEDETSATNECRYEFGIPVDSFQVKFGQIKKNQTLSDLLADYRLSALSLERMALLTNSDFDVRRIRSGKPFNVFLSPDSANQLTYFVYHDSPTTSIIFDFRDSLQITEFHKPVETVTKEITGVISSSLWNTMSEVDANPQVAVQLSEIYAWVIDFFGLQKGDHFKIIYEEQYVDTVSVGVGKVYGAMFHHAGKDFYAIPFEQNNKVDYFDLNGNSLRKAFLKAPLKFSRISSRFSNSRLHPVLKIRRPHHGIDYAAPKGTPVYAIGDGKVVKRGYFGGGGNMLTLKHNGMYSTSYLHLSRFGKGVENGSYVRQGQIIGYVGSTGISTGAHLDFRFYKDGKPVDPLKIEAPSIEPVMQENRAQYDSVKNEVIRNLVRNRAVNNQVTILSRN